MATITENDNTHAKEEDASETKDADVCPGISDVTTDDLQLPYEEKLEICKKDAETLYEFAISKGLSYNEMRSCLSPILGEKRSIGKRVASDSSKSVMTLSVIVAIAAILWGVPTSRDLIMIHARLLSVKTVQIWDWTPLYFEDCIVNNPFLPAEKNYTEEDCIGCIEFQEIEHLKDVDTQMINDEFLYADVPCVIADGDKNFPTDASGELLFTLNRLKEMFQEHPMLTEALTECEFISSYEKYKTMTQFVEGFSKNELPNKFHFAWENCDPNAAKVFRVLAARPYFIPPSAELSPQNQVIVAQGNFEDMEFTIPQQIDSASWLIVLYGEMKITLIPHNDCMQYKCKEHSFYLTEGSAVLVPSRIWNMTYSPSSYTLAYASTLVWDEVA